MPGPTPKPDSERRRRNAPTHEWVDLEVRSTNSPPALPEFRKWQSATVEWWESIWSKGQSDMWDPTGESLWTLASLMDDLFAGRVETQKVSSEIRQHEDRHGLNPKAMMQLRWRFAADVEEVGAMARPVEKRNRRKAALKVLEGGG